VRVLILDNNIDKDSWGASDLRNKAVHVAGITLSIRRPPHDDFPKSVNSFDKIIISGSKTSCLEQGGWIEKLDDLIKTFIHDKKPVLGVCYGHQSICRVMGGVSTLRRSLKPEMGWPKIEVTHPSTLFNGLGSHFYSFSRHFEEVHTLPRGLIKTAQSADCDIQAFEHVSAPIFGIQFHPERDLKEAQDTLIKLKKTNPQMELLNFNNAHALFNQQLGVSIFKNFLNL